MPFTGVAFMATRRGCGVLEAVVQVEHACGLCPMSQARPVSGSVNCCRGWGPRPWWSRRTRRTRCCGGSWMLSELRRRLELRIAELERRLGMDSSDSGTPSWKERTGAKEARRARRQESERERRKDRSRGGQPGHPGQGPAAGPGPGPAEGRGAAGAVPPLQGGPGGRGWRRSRAGRRRPGTWKSSRR